jgi:hypothetical protein
MRREKRSTQWAHSEIDTAVYRVLPETPSNTRGNERDGATRHNRISAFGFGPGTFMVESAFDTRPATFFAVELPVLLIRGNSGKCSAAAAANYEVAMRTFPVR